MEEWGAGKVCRGKVYASKGLRRDGAWEACWKEMERVDVEVEPVVEVGVQGELERLVVLQMEAEEQRRLGMEAAELEAELKREAAVLAARPDLVRFDGTRYRLTPEGRRWARAHDNRPDTNPVANRLYWLLYRIAGLDKASALDAARRGGLDASGSRVAGWGKHPTDRRHAAMTLDELEALMGGILDMDRDDDPRI